MSEPALRILVRILTIVGYVIVPFVIAPGLIWYERRLLGFWQERYGPNRVGPAGAFQIVADMVKIFFKEDWVPPFADRLLFIGAPAIIVVTVMVSFSVVPVSPGVVVFDSSIGVLIFLAMSSLGAYSVILAGWASDNKYSLLGGFRSAAQVLSYEVFMALSLMGVVLQAGSFNLNQIVMAQENVWFIVPQAVGAVVFLIAALAETHRLPFDLPEAESELVAGYHSEYSGMKFGLFFVGEYLGIVLMSSLFTTFFLGGWRGLWDWLPPIVWFFLKLGVVISFFVLMRAALPRPRYDQLMAYGWRVLLPLVLINVTGTGFLVLLTRG